MCLPALVCYAKRMSEQQNIPPLTAEQQEFAELLITECGLEEVADVTLNMLGQSGTVFYGLGRCAHHLSSMTPQQVKAMVMLQLEQQANPS